MDIISESNWIESELKQEIINQQQIHIENLHQYQSNYSAKKICFSNLGRRPESKDLVFLNNHFHDNMEYSKKVKSPSISQRKK